MKKVQEKIIMAFFPPFFLYLFQYLAQKFFGIYFLYPNFDIPMHLLGGVTMAMTGLSLLTIAEDQKWLLLKKNPVFLRILLVVFFVALMAVLWEFHEFLMDHFLGTHMQPSTFDTMKDLFLGLFGALIGTSVLSKKSL